MLKIVKKCTEIIRKLKKFKEKWCDFDMGLKKLSLRHREIAVMLLAGKKTPEIADKLDMHPWSVYRITEDPLFKDYSLKLFLIMAKGQIEKQIADMGARRRG